MMYTNLKYTEQIDLKVKVFLVTDMKRKSINDNLITLKAVKRRCFFVYICIISWDATNRSLIQHLTDR